MAVILDVAGLTHRGRREVNEDAVEVGTEAGTEVGTDGWAVVCDGVGSTPDAARAARRAAAAVREAFATGGAGARSLPALLHLPRVVRGALARARPALHPAAATSMAVACVQDGLLHALSVGDCRVAVLRRDTELGRDTEFGRDTELGRDVPPSWGVVSTTADHDRLALLVRDYALLPHRPDPALARRAARCLLQALRPYDGEETACVVTTALAPGDVVLVTSDGVHDALGHAGISAVLAAGDRDASSSDALSTALIMAALDRGSGDNCTAAVLRCCGAPAAGRTMWASPLGEGPGALGARHGAESHPEL